jgi:ribonuclease HII
MSRALVLGIDEAGRGPVIGPLVLCGVWLPRAMQRKLVDLGVRDSKTFGSSSRARRRRRELSRLMANLVSHVTLLVVEAEEVDRRVALGELNLLEQELAWTIIDTGPTAARIIADGRRLFGPLTAHHANLEARDKADESCPAVAAASILAKVERDLRFEEIVSPYQDALGPIRGGGYVNKGTEAFVRGFFSRFGRFPPGMRCSWRWQVLDELGIQRPTMSPKKPRKSGRDKQRQLLLES